MRRIITINSNQVNKSVETKKILTEKLTNAGFEVTYEFCQDAELIISIGGDGSFLKTVHDFDFTKTPIIGINTGHLGFYQEVSPDKLEKFIEDYNNGDYSIEELKLVEAEIFTRNKSLILSGVNEIVLKAKHSKIIHTNVYVNRNFLEKFSGDGLLISTPSGSTAYNFSFCYLLPLYYFLVLQAFLF